MANPWETKDRVVGGQSGINWVPGTGGQKPPTNYAVPGTAQPVAPITGGPDDLNTIREQAAAREGTTSAIQTQAQIRAAQARAGIDLDLERKKRALPLGGNQQFDNTSALRTELEGRPTVKVYKGAMPSYASALTSPDTPAGDLNMIYAFAKIMDPDSVVREGEADSVAGLGTIGQRIAGELRKQLDGSGRLSPDLRTQMRQTLGDRVSQYNKGYTSERARFRALATKQGIDPDLVVGPHFGDAYATVENQYFRGDPNKGPQAARDEAAARAALPPLAGGQTGGPSDGGPGGPLRVDIGGGGGGGSPEFRAGLRALLDDPNSTADQIRQYWEKGATSGAQHSGPGIEPTAPETSIPLGLFKGVTKPFDRAAMGLEAGYNWLTKSKSHSAADVSGERATAIDKLGKPDWRGEMAGTIGTSFLLPGGPVVSGALSNALAGDSTTKGGVAKDMLLGGMFGKLGDTAMKGAAGIVAPSLRSSVTNLANDGVRLTPGRMFGGRLANMEDRATSLPVAGPRILESQGNSLADFNLARARETMGKVGEVLPAGTGAGHQAVKAARTRLGQMYDDTTSQITAGLDPTFQTRWGAIQARAARDGLPQAQMDELNTIMQRDVGGAFTPRKGMFGGRDYKRLDERLGDISSSYGRSDDPYQRQLGGFVGKLNDQVGALVRRQNPAQAGDLRNLDTAWAHFARLRDAASRDVDNGIASPSQWEQAVRAGDRSMAKGRTAEGDALFQGPVSDAKDVFSSKFGSSGTADREALTDWKAWLAGTAVAPLYKEGTQRVLQSLLTSPRPAAAKPIAKFMKRLPAGAITPLLFAPR